MNNRFHSFHHFKGNNLSPSEIVQRKIIQLLLKSKVPDSKRDSSIVFELKHSSGVIEVARILAEKRNLDVTLAEVIAVLHDINVIIYGSYKDHAIKGGKIAKKILQKIGGFSTDEINLISNAVSYHSEKTIYSKDPYVELIKDADVFSCSYFENSEDGYRRDKSSLVFQHTVSRIQKVRKELGLPKEPVFRR